MYSTRRRQTRRQRDDRRGTLLLGFSAVAAVGLFAAYLLVRPVPLSCPEDGPTSLVVFLVDATDDLTSVQRASLRNEFLNRRESMVATQGMLLYRVADTQSRLLEPVGKLLCRPYKSNEVSPLTANPGKAGRLWQSFLEASDRAWEVATATGASDRSPVLESLQSVAATELTSPRFRSRPRELIVVSDLLQNTDEFSQYSQIIPFETFASSAYFRRTQADLTGVKVFAWYINREGAPQGVSHIEFWQQWFAASGASLDGVKRIGG